MTRPLVCPESRSALWWAQWGAGGHHWASPRVARVLSGWCVFPALRGTAPGPQTASALSSPGSICQSQLSLASIRWGQKLAGFFSFSSPSVLLSLVSILPQTIRELPPSWRAWASPARESSGHSCTDSAMTAQRNGLEPPGPGGILWGTAGTLALLQGGAALPDSEMQRASPSFRGHTSWFPWSHTPVSMVMDCRFVSLQSEQQH